MNSHHLIILVDNKTGRQKDRLTRRQIDIEDRLTRRQLDMKIG